MTEPFPPVDPSALNEMMQKVSAAFQEAARRFVAIFEPGLIAAGQEIQRCIAVLDEQWPAWREFAANVGDWEPEPVVQDCRCFCGVAHGGYGICVSDAEPGLFVVGRLGNERIDIPVCRNCFETRTLVAASFNSAI